MKRPDPFKTICKGRGFNCPNCKDRKTCEDASITYSNTELRLFDHSRDKVIYEKLTQEQLDKILKIILVDDF